MTGGLGTVLDNSNRNRDNRKESSRWKDFQERIKKANSPKTPHESTIPENDTPEFQHAKKIAIAQIQKNGQLQRKRERIIYFISGLIAIISAALFFIYIM